MSTYWTPDQIAEITRRIASGQTQAEAGAAFGRSRYAVKALLAREGERRGAKPSGGGRWSQEEVEIATAMKAAGETDVAIGAKLGRTALAVKNYRQKQAPPAQTPSACAATVPRPYTAEELAWAKARPLNPEAVLMRAMSGRMSRSEWDAMVRKAVARVARSRRIAA